MAGEERKSGPGPRPQAGIGAQVPAPPPVVESGEPPKTTEDPLDDKLRELRAQMGERWWSERVAQARERESLVLAVRAGCASGLPLSEAIAAAIRTSPTKPHVTTISRWMARFKRQGWVGLVDRRGHSESADNEMPTRSKAKSPRGSQPLSFLKWAGSKRGVMSELLRFFPRTFGTYYEPMVGSGSVFFVCKPDRAVLGDINLELMDTFQVVRDSLEPLLEALERHENTAPHYHRVRAEDPTALSPVDRAARMIFLNKTCFNGLYRVNSAGFFNVPFGRTPHANISDHRTLGRASALLQGVVLQPGDYRETLRDAGAGDLVYLDPPYLVPGTRGGRCHRYQPEAFDERAHEELAEVFRDLDARGCAVVLSNSDVPEVRGLYRGYRIEVLSTRRNVHFSVDRRTGYTEVVVSNRDPQPSADQLSLFTE